MKLLQDAAVILLALTLLALAFMFLWRVWQEIVGSGDLLLALSDITLVLSDITLVVVAVELYRLGASLTGSCSA